MFGHLKPGDKVTRMLAGTIPVELTVNLVKNGLIVAGGLWTFDAETGAEIDEGLNWGPPPLSTGSFLKPETTK